MEWINPEYADLVEAMKQAEAEDSEDGPRRWFIVPAEN